MDTRKFLITGTGRCGTMFASKYLIAKGLDVLHEKMGKNGTSAWDLASKQRLFFKEDVEIPKFDYVLHIVREPLAVINSFAITVPQWESAWLFISQNSPVELTDSQLLKSMKHWYHWNLMAGEMANKTIRIEDWNMNTIGDIFGISGPEPATRKNLNSRQNWNVMGMHYTMEDCLKEDEELASKIKSLAAHYGYS